MPTLPGTLGTCPWATPTFWRAAIILHGVSPLVFWLQHSAPDVVKVPMQPAQLHGLTASDHHYLWQAYDTRTLSCMNRHCSVCHKNSHTLIKDLESP